MRHFLASAGGMGGSSTRATFLGCTCKQMSATRMCRGGRETFMVSNRAAPCPARAQLPLQMCHKIQTQKGVSVMKQRGHLCRDERASPTPRHTLLTTAIGRVMGAQKRRTLHHLVAIAAAEFDSTLYVRVTVFFVVSATGEQNRF